MESLATQTLVLFVIRTPKNPLTRRPRVLAITTVAIGVVGVLLPYSPLSTMLAFVPLPGAYFPFLSAATLTYFGPGGGREAPATAAHRQRLSPASANTVLGRDPKTLSVVREIRVWVIVF